MIYSSCFQLNYRSVYTILILKGTYKLISSLGAVKELNDTYLTITLEARNLKIVGCATTSPTL